MTSPLVRRSVGAFVVAALAAHLGWSAEQARPTAQTGKSPASAQRAPAGRVGSAKGPLPDPTLLDGSTLPVEKKSEHGMIGDFELPGDENVRNGKVGGPQNQNPSAAGGQSNTPMGMPQGGGGPQSPQQQGGAQAAQGGQQPPAGAQQAGGAAGGPQNADAAGNPVAGAGDQGGQPQGAQVAELGGAASGQQQAGGGPGEKPKQVAIGDSAMRIDPSATAGVVGAQQQQQPAGHTQQHDKGTGSGGKGAGGAGSGNRVEKGRVIPTGL